MFGLMTLGFMAGLLSIASPCVIPILPLILNGALAAHRLAPLALAAGLATAFTATGLFIASLGLALDIDSGLVRQAAAVLMSVFGAILLLPSFESRFSRLAGPLSRLANDRMTAIVGDSLGGQFVLGGILGAAWSPCAGPTLGAAIGLASQAGSLVNAALVMASFSLGATTPLVLLAYGSRRMAQQSRTTLATLSSWAKPIMGGLLLTLGALLLTGLDRQLEIILTAAMPSWLMDLTTRF